MAASRYFPCWKKAAALSEYFRFSVSGFRWHPATRNKTANRITKNDNPRREFIIIPSGIASLLSTGSRKCIGVAKQSDVRSEEWSMNGSGRRKLGNPYDCRGGLSHLLSGCVKD